MMDKISICILFYGDYRQQATRCLSSVDSAIADWSYIADVRLGLNPDEQGRCWAREFSREWAAERSETFDTPVLLYEPETNARKYPLMRRMVHAPVPNPGDAPIITSEGDLLLWLDDDSYFKTPLPAEWWEGLRQQMSCCDLLGEYRWFMPLQGNQWKWIRSQPWCNQELGMPAKRKVRGKGLWPCFKFVQGGFWVTRFSLLRKYNWPVPEIHHNGGDSMLGELCRHQKLRVVDYSDGLAINADERGRNSKAKRRGHSDKHRVGALWSPSTPIDLSHQTFPCKISVYREGIPYATMLPETV